LLFQTIKFERSISGDMTVKFKDGGEIVLRLVKQPEDAGIELSSH
jgi:hypothetical protein